MGVLPCHAIARPPRSVLFWPTHKPRRPEQVCFSPSTSLDAPNKFVFAHPQASTPRTSLFFSIHELRRSEQRRTAGAAASDIECQAAPGTSTSLWHGQLYTRLSDVMLIGKN